MPRYTEEAVVLRSINYKDTDKIYTLFTKDRGKISASARGVRKISSRRGGNLDTLNYIKVGITEGDNKKYRIITEVETINPYKDLKSSLSNSVKGFYIAELVYELVDEGQKSIPIFNLLIDSLDKLNTHLNNEVSRINAFEIKLMELLGYELYLDKCAKTDKPYDGNWETIKFSPTLGGFVSVENEPGFEISKQAADLLNALKTKRNINKKLLENEEVTKEVDKIMKTYVRNILEKHFRTERVFGEI